MGANYFQTRKLTFCYVMSQSVMVLWSIAKVIVSQNVPQVSPVGLLIHFLGKKFLEVLCFFGTFPGIG